MAKVVLPKVKHILTIGADKYSFKAPDIYGSVGSTLGVTKAPSPDNTIYTGRLGSDSFSDGTAIKLKARGVSGTGATKKVRDFTFIVAFEKAKSALATLESKTVTADSVTYDLTSARIPQRRRFS